MNAALSSDELSDSHEMFFFTFLAHPRPGHPEYGTVDGAYVACWVAEPVESVAEGIAREAIEVQNWDVEERDEGYPVSLDDYEFGGESRERCEQAAIDGVVLTFHTWPVGAPDEDQRPGWSLTLSTALIDVRIVARVRHHEPAG